jgi:hypothetical protein
MGHIKQFPRGKFSRPCHDNFCLHVLQKPKSHSDHLAQHLCDRWTFRTFDTPAALNQSPDSTADSRWKPRPRNGERIWRLALVPEDIAHDQTDRIHIDRESGIDGIAVHVEQLRSGIIRPSRECCFDHSPLPEMAIEATIDAKLPLIFDGEFARVETPVNNPVGVQVRNTTNKFANQQCPLGCRERLFLQQ